jgi:hypothetical protein
MTVETARAARSLHTGERVYLYSYAVAPVTVTGVRTLQSGNVTIRFRNAHGVAGSVKVNGDTSLIVVTEAADR